MGAGRRDGSRARVRVAAPTAWGCSSRTHRLFLLAPAPPARRAARSPRRTTKVRAPRARAPPSSPRRAPPRRRSTRPARAAAAPAPAAPAPPGAPGPARAALTTA